jgi:hypothetical protein
MSEISDGNLSEQIADRLLEMWPPGRRAYHLMVRHDRAPCSLSYDRKGKNHFFITTRDRARAKQWIIEASLAGSTVTRRVSGRSDVGYRYGSLAQLRQYWVDPTNQNGRDRKLGAAWSPTQGLELRRHRRSRRTQ